MSAAKGSRAGQKAVRGVGEGSVVAALTDLGADAVVQWVPWFSSRRTALIVVLGAGIGALVRMLASRYVWKTGGRP